MGTSMYHMGLQYAGWKQSVELTVLSQAMYNARELAVERMVTEAVQLDADGIVGVDHWHGAGAGGRWTAVA
jgi:uncharacterized protein YbjQ (UPF0145 family)